MDPAPKKWRMRNPFFIHDGSSRQCGICGIRPKCLQVFNNMKFFLLFFICFSIFRGMMHSYMASMVPSMEKRFGFSSETIGVIKAMSDVSHLMSALFIAHYGGSKSSHRPRWIAAGAFLMGLGFLLYASPEFFFPLHKSSAMYAVSKTDPASLVCHLNSSRTDHREASCKEPKALEGYGPVVVFGLADFLVGLGGAVPIILGMPFVDDHVKSSNTPLYYAATIVGQIFGPLVGLAMGSGLNTVYFDFTRPDFKASDPRWISAWYLGFIICGLGVCFFALTIGCFPASIPEKISVNHEKTLEVFVEPKKEKSGLNKSPESKPISIKDLPRNLKRLATNYTYLVKLFSQLINGFVIAGYMSFSKKFMQEQYRLPQSTVTLIGGMPPIFAGFIGTLIGGYIVKRFKLRPTQVCYMIMMSTAIGASCYFGIIGMGCEKQPIIGVDDVANPHNISDANVCFNSNGCRCRQTFSPVCDGVNTYVSPCVAGCSSFRRINNTNHYFDCSCMVNQNSSFSEAGSAFPRSVKTGTCPKPCPNFAGYVALITIAKFFAGIPFAGYMMLQFRIVDVDLKSLAQAVSTIVMSAFGFLPAPIVIGRLIDSSCRLWQQSSCGAKGACWLYNADDFRWKLHAMLAIVRVICFGLDGIIAYRVRDMEFKRPELEGPQEMMTQDPDSQNSELTNISAKSAKEEKKDEKKINKG